MQMEVGTHLLEKQRAADRQVVNPVTVGPKSPLPLEALVAHALPVADQQCLGDQMLVIPPEPGQQLKLKGVHNLGLEQVVVHDQ